MDDQIIIAIGREHGSLGHEIAVRLAEKLGYDLYDREILQKLAETHSIDPEFMRHYDEKPRNFLVSRRVNGYSNSLEDILNEHVFEYERELAASGKNFIIVGRCSDVILQDEPGLVSIFMMADEDKKLRHIMNSRGKTEKEARQEIRSVDRDRRNYYHHYSGGNWKDMHHYDLVLNSSRLGLEGTIEVICNYIALKKYHLTGDFPDQE